MNYVYPAKVGHCDDAFIHCDQKKTHNPDKYNASKESVLELRGASFYPQHCQKEQSLQKPAWLSDRLSVSVYRPIKMLYPGGLAAVFNKPWLMHGTADYISKDDSVVILYLDLIVGISHLYYYWWNIPVCLEWRGWKRQTSVTWLTACTAGPKLFFGEKLPQLAAVHLCRLVHSFSTPASKRSQKVTQEFLA